MVALNFNNDAQWLLSNSISTLYQDTADITLEIILFIEKRVSSSNL
jgi:hypothetical protein